MPAANNQKKNNVLQAIYVREDKNKIEEKKLGSYVLRFDQYWTSRRWRSNLVADPAVGILDAARPCCMNATVICCYLLEPAD